MRAIIPSLSVKAFQSILGCLAKIGDDVVVEARPDRLVLSTLNITRSAFATFTFERNFFESYHLDTTGEAIKQDELGPYLRCTILAKGLVSSFKIRGKAEEKVVMCVLLMNSAEGVGEDCRLQINMIYKGINKLHKLLYESCREPLRVLETIESCPSSWRLPPQAMVGFMENFSIKAEEISMKCNQDGITFQTFKDSSEEDTGGQKRYGTTTVPINRRAMESYRLQDDVEIVFSLKEFKAILGFALTMRLPVDAHFDARCRPILMTVVSENIFSADFALATVINEEEHRELTSNARAAQWELRTKMEDTRAQASHGHHNSGQSHHGKGGLDLTQPENALFLDDDAEWLGALGDIEMEEAAEETSHMANCHSSTHDVPAARPSRGRSSAIHNAQTHEKQPEPVEEGGEGELEQQEDAYEIEEDFMPSTQRDPKRLRFNFDEDD